MSQPIYLAFPARNHNTKWNIVCVCLCVCMSCRGSNKQTHRTNRQINEFRYLQCSDSLSPSDFRAVICGDGEEMWADVLRYHDGVLLIDGDSVISELFLLFCFLFRSVPDSRQKWWMPGFCLTKARHWPGIPESHFGVQLYLSYLSVLMEDEVTGCYVWY